MIGDVGRKVHGESDTHDEDNHADHVQVDVPEGHHAKHPDLHRDDCEQNPNDANLAGDEDKDNNGHDPHTKDDTGQCLVEHFSKLIKDEEKWIENLDLDGKL